MPVTLQAHFPVMLKLLPQSGFLQPTLLIIEIYSKKNEWMEKAYTQPAPWTIITLPATIGQEKGTFNHFWKIIFTGYKIFDLCFLFPALWMFSQCLLVFIVSIEMWIVNILEFLCKWWVIFLLLVSNFLFVFQHFYYNVFGCGSLCFSYLEFVELPGCVDWFFFFNTKFEKFQLLLLQIFFSSPFFTSDISITCRCCVLIGVPTFSKVINFLSFNFLSVLLIACSLLIYLKFTDSLFC